MNCDASFEIALSITFKIGEISRVGEKKKVPNLNFKTVNHNLFFYVFYMFRGALCILSEFFFYFSLLDYKQVGLIY